jgi:hypothetical protein
MILGLISISNAAATVCQCEFEGAEYHVWYLDSDGDGLGDAFNARIGCIQPLRYVNNCLDLDDTSHDNMPISMQGMLQEWFRDYDNDGFGDATQVMISAICPPGFVGDHTDLDDHNETIWFDENAQELLTRNKEH